MALLLTKLELQNLFGLNVWRHTSDSAGKRKKALNAAAIGVLCLYLFLLSGAQVYAAARLGALRLAGQLPGLSASMVIFLLSLFDRSLYAEKGYELLCALPVSKRSICLSRMLRMYSFYLLVSILCSVSGLGAFAWIKRPDFFWYLRTLIGVFLIPLLPLAGSMVLHTAVLLISCRFRHKTTVQTLMEILIVLPVFAVPYGLSALNGSDFQSPEQLFLAQVALVRKTFPGWFCAWSEAFPDFLLYAVVSLLCAAVTAELLCRNFAALMQKQSAIGHTLRNSGSISARRSVTTALYQKEARRYFASPIYVSNTLIGPILATAAAVACVFVDLSAVQKWLPVPLIRLIPAAWSMICCMETAAAVSVSMEGNRVWILQSLPVSAKQVLRAKLLWSLTLILPAYLGSEAVLLIGLKPGWSDALWLILFPAVMAVFSCVFALNCDLRFHNFRWEKEEEAVKQSAASLIGGMVPSLASAVCGVVLILVPVSGIRLMILAGAVVLTLLLCRSSRKKIQPGKTEKRPF